MPRLTDERICWLATTRPDGRPHLSPIWFVWVDDRFWVCTTGSAVKVRNVGAQPAVAVSLQDGGAPLVAEGRAVIHTAPFPPAVAEAFRARFDWDVDGDPDGYDTMLEITVERWLMGDPTS